MLAYLQLEGSPFEVGQALGRFGAAALQGYAARSPAWATVMRWRGHAAVAAMAELVRARQPAIWQELQGLAAGLGLPAEDVFLWNCRGDVWAMAPDGCTTVQLPATTPDATPVVAHNEDGDPAFLGHCAIAQIAVTGGARFASFVYPGSLPGHTFATTDSGLVMTVNNLRTLEVGLGLPRMVVTRALLDAAGVDAALEQLGAMPRAGGFHLTLAQAGLPCITSVEFSDAVLSVQTVERPAVHANHMVHAAMANRPQIVTGSSGHRQLRGEDLLRQHEGEAIDPLDILFDQGDARYPVYRDRADDSDHENTMATASFELGAAHVDWVVRTGGRRETSFRMRDALRL